MIVIKSKLLRKILKFSLPMIAIPFTVLCGIYVFDEKRYAFVSLAVALLSVVLFISGIEKKRIGTRRLVLVTIMTALSSIGRFIPFFKPVTSIAIITSLYLGAEAGFLVGSSTALITSFYFGLGPWTPFQMTSWGLIAFMSGIMKERLKKSRILLIAYGVLSGIIYSFIMDIWTVLWYSDTLTPALYKIAIIDAIPFTLLYIASNVFFLLVFSKPFGEKLERIQIKYGL